MDDLIFSARRGGSAGRGAHGRAPDVETRFRTLVQSPLRAGLLRYLSSRPDESFDVEALMQTFGRMQLDVDNCVQRAGRLRRRAEGARQPAALLARAARPTRRWPINSTMFLERRATVSTEDQSPSVQRFREMIGRDEKMLVVFEWIRTAAKSDISVLILGPDRLGQGSRRPHDPRAVAAQRRRSSRP